MSDETSSEGVKVSEEICEENSSHYGLEKSAAEEKSEKTLDGATALIYHESPDGSVEFYLEEKPANYAIERFRGKLSFVGGAIETKDDSPLEALVRELTEEVESKEAQDILIAELRRTQNLYEVISEQVNGKTTKTFVYIIKVDSSKDWKVIRNSPLTHDAGPKRVLSLGDILSRKEDDFAFSMGGVLFNFIKDAYSNSYKKVSGSISMPGYEGIKLTPSTPLITSSPLEATVRDFYSNPMLESVILISPYLYRPKTNLLHEQYLMVAYAP